DDQMYLVRQDQGIVQSDQAAVDVQKLNLVYCHITAPVDGRVGLRLVDPGNYVQTGSATGLVVITKLQPISVIFTLPEDDLGQIQKRLRAGATLPVTAWDRSNSEQIATGKFKLRATFANTDDALFPSQFVNARLLVDTVTGATLVPNAAVQTGAPGTYVYLANPDNTVSVRKVKTGPTDGTNTVIQSGLNPGDKVVVDGADRLRDGAKVTVPQPGAAPGAPPPQAPQRHRRGQGSSGGE